MAAEQKARPMFDHQNTPKPSMSPAPNPSGHGDRPAIRPPMPPLDPAPHPRQNPPNPTGTAPMPSPIPPAWTKFQPGQRVWLKRPSPGWQKRKHKIEALPQLGQIYTIRETLLNCEGHLFIRLVEVVNKPRKWRRDGFSELAFAAWWFEPVKEQNIEVFRQICLTAPTRQNQLEPAQ